jgi:hypothetical protein
LLIERILIDISATGRQRRRARRKVRNHGKPIDFTYQEGVNRRRSRTPVRAAAAA